MTIHRISKQRIAKELLAKIVVIALTIILLSRIRFPAQAAPNTAVPITKQWPEENRFSEILEKKMYEINISVRYTTTEVSGFSILIASADTQTKIYGTQTAYGGDWESLTVGQYQF